MSFKLGEIVYFKGLRPSDADKNGLEVRIIKLEGMHDGTDGKKMLGYGVRDETGFPWIVHKDNLERSKLERGDMDTKVSWYEFGLATGWYMRPEDLT